MFIGIGMDLCRGGGSGFFSGATLDMNFAAGAYLGKTPSALTVSRTGTTGYAESSTGVWVPFAANTARITDKGLLVEEGRTNGIKNNMMTGATVGVVGSGGALPTGWVNSPQGLTTTVVEIGTENGITYIDIRYSGTTSGQFALLFFGANNDIAATAAQAWSHSVFLKLVAGSFTNVAQYGTTTYYYDAVPASLSNTSTAQSMTSSLARYSQNVTTVTSTAFVRPGFYYNMSAASGQAVDFTVRIGMPQIEQGAFATSPIPTTSAAQARGTDTVSLAAGAAFSDWYTNATAGTIYGEMSHPGSIVGSPKIFAVSDNTTANLMDILMNTTSDLHGSLTTASVSLFNTGSAIGTTAGVVHKSIIAGTTNDRASCTNGGTVNSNTTAGSNPTVDRAHIGNRSDGARPLCGYVRRVAYWPSRLANATLQTLTA